MQALQIVRGGRDPDLRLRGTLPALRVLEARRVVATHAARVLREGYLFLRALEHRLQYRDDRQTQRLPTDSAERAWLGESLGFASTLAFDAALASHRDQVARQFNAVFDAPDERKAAGEPPNRYVGLWDEPHATPETLLELEGAGFEAPADLVQGLARMRESRRYLQLPALSRDRVDRLVPRLIDVAAEHRDAGAAPTQVLQRLLALLEAVSGRSAYLALLIEHPPLLPRLAQLMGASAWAADYLTRRPLLLDELLDARVLLAEPDWTAWRIELDRLLAPHANDAEAAMDALRHFQHAQTFRLLAQDLAGQLSVERLADHLSALADAILAATLACCWSNLRGPGDASPRFAIVGYGKLGGKELGYASDLDLVFLYDTDRTARTDDVLPSATRASRSGSIRGSPAPPAREGCTRRIYGCVRDGAAGLMVSSIGAFERYQRGQAWTWEHQALTRARFVAGDTSGGIGVRGHARERAARSARARASRVGHRRDARAHGGGPRQSDAVVRLEARSGWDGRHRVRRAIPRARLRPPAPRADP